MWPFKRRTDDDFRREIEAHIALETDRLVAEGLSPDDARHAAARTFGNVTAAQERFYESRRVLWLDQLRQDVRYALRTLARSPGFAIVAILTLALGIGANTAIFSVVNAVILRPLPYPQPEQLRFLTTRFERQGLQQFWVSPPEYFELTELGQSFSVIGAYRTTEANLAARDRPHRVRTAIVNAELLEALAVQPEHGRWFSRDEARVNGPALVILSHELWRSAFVARPDIVGETIDVNGVMREVIGVMPAGFDVLDNRIELLLPLDLNPANRQNRGNHFLYLVGRLNDGVNTQEAEAELASLMPGWGQRLGVRGHTLTAGDHVLQMEPLDEEIVGSARRAIWVVQAAVAFVLFIACANFANLLLARAEGRRRELATRAALGAGRGRLLTLFTTEGVMLSLLGGAVGLGVAWLGLQALVAVYADSLPRAADITLDETVLAFTLVLSIGTGVVFGLAPLVHLSGGEFNRLSIGQSTRSATPARRFTRGTLVAGEVALAVVLVVGAGLLLRTVVNLMHVDAGFDRSRLVTFGVQLPAATYPTFEQGLRFYQRLLERLSNIPGVTRVSVMSGLPPRRQVNANGTDVEGYVGPPEAPHPIVDYYQTVTSGHFDVMGIPIVQGRGFEPSDRIGAPVAVVNETFARMFWQGANPVGRRVRPRSGGQAPWMTVVGVARDVKQGGVDRETGSELYFLLEQLRSVFPHSANAQLGAWEDGSMKVVLRTALPTAALQPPIEAVVRDEDSSLPIIRLRDMEEVIRDSVRRPVMLLHLFAGFAGIALLLAAVGIYGVLSYIVTERRREIGIRIALGARPQMVLGSVVRYGLKLTSVGLAAGFAAALGLTRLLETLLFGIQPSDPVTFCSVAIAMTLVAAAASFVPAYRALRVDPIVALRNE